MKNFLILIISTILFSILTIKGNAESHLDSLANSSSVKIDLTERGSSEDSKNTKVVQIDSGSLFSVPYIFETENPRSSSTQTLFSIFAAGFIAGLIAFLLPCIFPMVPLTVSYFTKRAETKGKGIQGAILYGISIIVIYVVLGLLITLIFGASALNELATDGFFNVFIFLILLLFGMSFLGAFEITLPNSFVNKIDSRSDSKGLTGIFFMATTLAVVSFSCTGPLIGTLLVTVGQTGGFLAPIMGMFGFSLALASIFVIFAIFPSWMTSLPKSGGWLNSIKVVLGFIEIALALKFLSTADLAYHWGILDREIFISIWIVIAFILGFYLLGKIKFLHDSNLSQVSIPRLFLSGSSFVFAFYLIPGLWGAPLKAVSAFVPPLSTQDFILTQDSKEIDTAKANNPKRKYSDFLEIPLKIDGFFDYEEALSYAKKVKKPIFLDFTGHGCVNCREMEAKVWSDSGVLKTLKEDYIVVSLYTDEKTVLPKAEQFYSKVLNAEVNTIGKKFKHLQAERFNTISQPYYVLLGTNEKELVSPPIGVELDVKKYHKYLTDGLESFSANKNK